MKAKKAIGTTIIDMFRIAGWGHFAIYYALALVMVVLVFLRIDTTEPGIRVATAVFTVVSAVLYPFSTYVCNRIFRRLGGGDGLLVFVTMGSALFIKFLQLFLGLIVKFILPFGFAVLIAPFGILYLYASALIGQVAEGERAPGRLMIFWLNLVSKMNRRGVTFKRDEDGNLICEETN